MFKNRIELLYVIPQGSVVAELGVFIGEYSQKILDIVKPSKLYLVDVFKEGNAHSSGIHVKDLSLYYGALCRKYIKDKRVEVVKASTTGFLDSLPKETLDAVYIDADHSYEAVKSDLFHCYDKVKSSGLIMGHDYDRSEIKKAVKEFCNYYGLSVYFVTNEPQPSFVIRKGIH